MKKNTNQELAIEYQIVVRRASTGYNSDRLLRVKKSIAETKESLYNHFISNENLNSFDFKMNLRPEEINTLELILGGAIELAEVNLIRNSGIESRDRVHLKYDRMKRKTHDAVRKHS